MSDRHRHRYDGRVRTATNVAHIRNDRGRFLQPVRILYRQVRKTGIPLAARQRSSTPKNLCHWFVLTNPAHARPGLQQPPATRSPRHARVAQ